MRASGARVVLEPLPFPSLGSLRPAWSPRLPSASHSAAAAAETQVMLPKSLISA